MNPHATALDPVFSDLLSKLKAMLAEAADPKALSQLTLALSRLVTSAVKLDRAASGTAPAKPAATKRTDVSDRCPPQPRASTDRFGEKLPPATASASSPRPAAELHAAAGRSLSGPTPDLSLTPYAILTGGTPPHYAPGGPRS